MYDIYVEPNNYQNHYYLQYQKVLKLKKTHK